MTATVMTELRRRAYIDAILERHGVFRIPTGWERRAACRGETDTTLFFGKSSRGRSLCERCPVGPICLLAALDEEDDIGDLDYVVGRRYIAASHRRAFLDRYRHHPDGAPRGDDVALMLALCERIAHNLNQGDPQP